MAESLRSPLDRNRSNGPRPLLGAPGADGARCRDGHRVDVTGAGHRGLGVVVLILPKENGWYPCGELTMCYGKSPFFINGLQVGMFNSELLNYR